jgi:hypothetical protein
MIQLTATVCATTFVISRFDLQLPWDKSGFRWLDDPLETDGISTLYRFGNMYEFERKQVLNHRADVCRMLRRGQSIKGALLGIDMAPIPDEFRDGSLFPATVIIYDQFWREYRAPVELTVARPLKRAHRTGWGRGGLFDKRDTELWRYNRIVPQQPVAPAPTPIDKEFEEIWKECLEEINKKRTKNAPVLS